MKWFLAVALLAMSSFASAGAWTGKLPITSLYLHATYDGLFINQTVTSADPSIMQCNRDMYFLPRTHVFFKEIYAMLLSARATGSSVDLYLDACTTGVGGYRPIISFVRDAD
jgi:hypothetical protein